MIGPAKETEQSPESYSPKGKPKKLKLIKKIVGSTSEIPAIEIYQTHREPYRILGNENKTLNGTVGDWGACWNQFFKSGGHEKIKPFLIEQPLLGVFCQSDPGYYNYLIGGVVSGVTDPPEGMFLADFPSTNYIVVTHEWMQSIDKAEQQIGRIVGYAHSNEMQLPGGYVKYNGPPSPLIFIESYNYDFDNNLFRFEVWLPIRSINEPAKKTESYSPKSKPEIYNIAENALKNEQNRQLSSEFVIMPKDKIAKFNGERWPFSNVEPAVYTALGLFYGRTEKRDEAGALFNSDMEYSIHNILTGHAFGLFYCLPDDSLSMAMYGLSSCRLKKKNYNYSEEEIKTIVKDSIFRGNAVYIDENSGSFAYFIRGYRDNGNILIGHKFEHGNDDMNCSYDFNNPVEFSWSKNFDRITLFDPNGEKLSKEVIYKQALANGYRMFTQTEPPLEMDFSRVHFGYGKAIYDEWIRQLEQANTENSEAFYFSSPVFPHFIALYENRLHLYKFLKMYAELCGNETLFKAAGLCEQLKNLTQEGAQITFENEWSDPEFLAMTNNERRKLLVELLKKCHALEVETAEFIKIFIDTPEISSKN